MLNPNPHVGWWSLLSANNIHGKDIHYHVGLCGQAGYVAVLTISGSGEEHPRYKVGNLTWEGHEALVVLRKNPMASTYK